MSDHLLRDPTAESSPVSRVRLTPGVPLASARVGLFSINKERSGEFMDYLQARLDAALGNGTIQFVPRGQIGFVALPTARGAANVPPAALLASVSVDRSARGLGDFHVHGAERAALRVTGGLMTSPIGSEFI